MRVLRWYFHPRFLPNLDLPPLHTYAPAPARAQVLGCPLKPESAPTLLHLRESSHALIMITGDAALTACHAAGQARADVYFLLTIVVAYCLSCFALVMITGDAALTACHAAGQARAYVYFLLPIVVAHGL